MRWLALAVLGACSFSPGALPGGTTSDARIDSGAGDDTSLVVVDALDAFVPPPPGKVRSLDIVDAKVTGTHVDFPLLVSLTGTWLRSTTNGGDVARNDGFDIYFTADQPGATRYAFEVETYDPVQGTLVAWVKVPLAPTSVVFVHYGDPADSTNTATPAAVWTAGYELVTHMNGGGDATGKNTVAGGALTQATGMIAGGRSFDGTTSTANAGTGAAVDDIFTGGGVLEAWFFADTFGGGGLGRLFDKNEYALFIDNTNPMAANAVTFYHECSGGNGVGYWHFNNVTMPAGAWHHVALAYNKDATTNTPVAYVDGAPVAALNSDLSSGTNLTDSASTVYLGQRAGGDRGFDGVLDELRMSSIVHTDTWYAAQFANQSAPAAFYTLSAPL